MSELVEVAVLMFDGLTGDHIASEIIVVPAPPPEPVAAELLAAQTARIEAAAQEGWITREQRDVITGA